jgi:hypothetical protein
MMGGGKERSFDQSCCSLDGYSSIVHCPEVGARVRPLTLHHIDIGVARNRQKLEENNQQMCVFCLCVPLGTPAPGRVAEGQVLASLDASEHASGICSSSY